MQPMTRDSFVAIQGAGSFLIGRHLVLFFFQESGYFAFFFWELNQTARVVFTGREISSRSIELEKTLDEVKERVEFGRRDRIE